MLLIRDMTRPNGIALSPDERYLYVANSDPNNPVWMRYARAMDGTLAPGEVLLSAKGAPGAGGPDGIKVDVRGNIYGAGPGGVWIISPKGEHIATIHVPERVSNCGWVGRTGRRCILRHRVACIGYILGFTATMCGIDEPGSAQRFAGTTVG